MRIPLAWLKEYCPTPLSPKEVAHTLTQLGLEVEGLEASGPAIEGVVTAKVLAVERHPHADKLSLCEVTDGQATFKVVCGAPNVSPGIIVPFARIGATLPSQGADTKPVAIKRSRIRGVDSDGMICSERELGISAEAEGIMHLAEATPLGEPVAQVLGLTNWVLDMSMPANRGDVLGLTGVARELCAATGVPMRLPPETPEETAGEAIGREVSVSLIADLGCPRYGARQIRGVRVGPSPAWIQRYLTLAGVRPINNVVDVTNFVMLESGHPMHAFDRSHIARGQIVVRLAREGERLIALDGREYALVPGDVVIADPTRVLALGGIIGGEQSGVGETTTDVVLEAAYFDPITIRKTARRLRIKTESSQRFERGCDPSAVPGVLDRACQLLSAYASGRPLEGRIDVYPRPVRSRRIPLRTMRVNRLLGTRIERFRIEMLLKALGLSIHETMDGSLLYDADLMVVEVPTWRPDLLEEVDLVEEVARHFGLDRIPPAPPLLASEPLAEDPIVAAAARLRRALTGRGLEEAVSLSFSDREIPKSIEITNPLTGSEGRLRVTVADGLIRALGLNLRRQEGGVRLFEIGRVFSRLGDGAGGEGTKAGFAQEYRAGILIAGEPARHWRASAWPLDFFHVKGLLEALVEEMGWALDVAPGEVPAVFDPALYHPRRVAVLRPRQSPDRVLGVLGEVHPGLLGQLRNGIHGVLAEVSLEGVVALGRRPPVAADVSPYPRATRDLAVVLPDTVSFARLREAVTCAGVPILESWELFDVFTGGGLAEGERSLAIALAFRHAERTLTDREVDAALERILQTLEREVGARLRS